MKKKHILSFDKNGRRFLFKKHQFVFLVAYNEVNTTGLNGSINYIRILLLHAYDKEMKEKFKGNNNKNTDYLTKYKKIKY